VTSTRQKAVFLDRDGTINVEVNYLHRTEDFAWIPGAPEAIARLNREGYLVVVVTNQAAVARGYCGEDDVRNLHRFIQEELRRWQGRIDAFYYCPYHPEGTVPHYRRTHPWRKPGTGMLEQAIADWGIDPDGSFLVGDRESDIEAGRRMGLKTLLVETGYGALERDRCGPDFVVADLPGAVQRILDSREHAL